MKAAVTANDDVKLDNLQRVKDIIVIRQPALLDNFLDEILNFQLDGNPVVRRFILDFILQAWYDLIDIILFVRFILNTSDARYATVFIEVNELGHYTPR